MFATTRKLLATLLVTALAVPLGACNDGLTSGDDSSMSLLLTDDPAGDLSQAWVEILEIELTGTQGGFVLLDSSTGLIELTSLANTTEDLVSDVAIPSGTYNQLRIVIGAAAVQTEDGDVFSKDGAASELGLTKTGDLTCPSCDLALEPGIKVLLPGGAITLDGEQKILVLDFDVAESYGREAGFADRWVMNPLIRTSELEVTGGIAGTVDGSAVSWPVCGGVQTSVEDFVPQFTDSEGAVAHSGVVQSDGSYEVEFVEPAEYGVSFASPVSFDGASLSFDDVDASEASVSVEDGATSTVDYTVKSVSCS